MVRPRKCRRISLSPHVRFFKPQGVPVRQLNVLALKEEELEALFLADVKDLEHEQAAAKMGISRSTFSRVLAQARKIVATALVEGAALRVEEGDFQKTEKGENDAEHG